VLDDRVKRFIEAFYAISDDPSGDEEWLGYFGRDATLYMGDKRAKGLGGVFSFPLPFFHFIYRILVFEGWMVGKAWLVVQ